MEAARVAAAADIAEISRLADDYAAELREQRGGPVFLLHERADVALDAFLDRDDARLVVGTIDDVIVGFATGEVAPLGDGTRLGVLADLYVHPDAREVGVGEAMVDLLLAWFEEEHCIGVDAYALPGSRATKNFFETNGFTARLLVMHRRGG